MTNIANLQNVIGHNAVDSNGDKIGKIGGIYLDDQTEEPRWVTVSTGLFGTKESFAPLYGATQDGDNLRLAVTKEQVKDAPNVDADGHLEESENDALYEHYRGFLGGGTGTDATTGGADTTTGGVDTTTGGNDYATSAQGERATTGGSDYSREGHDTSGPNTDNAMTRSEERVNVGTQRVEAGRAKLRKYVVTENVQQTVPVQHEEVRIEREPITDANVGAATDGPDISEEEHEVTLHAEQPVVQKETVPVERVALATETVTDEQTVNEQVRKEQIDETGVDQTR